MFVGVLKYNKYFSIHNNRGIELNQLQLSVDFVRICRNLSAIDKSKHTILRCNPYHVGNSVLSHKSYGADRTVNVVTCAVLGYY